MSVIKFPGDDSNEDIVAYHIMIEYEGADGQGLLAEGLGYLTTIGGFVCISSDMDRKDHKYYLPPVMIAFDRVIRIDADEATEIN